jgi:hypothetical protein
MVIEGKNFQSRHVISSKCEEQNQILRLKFQWLDKIDFIQSKEPIKIADQALEGAENLNIELRNCVESDQTKPYVKDSTRELVRLINQMTLELVSFEHKAMSIHDIHCK